MSAPSAEYILGKVAYYMSWAWVYGIKDDLWSAAVKSYADHIGELDKPWLITLVDFRISSKEPRLWTLNFAAPVPVLLFKTRVSHGKNSGPAYGPATSVSNEFRSNKSCVGGFITMHTYQSGLGQKSGKRPAMVIRGVDSTNSNARKRGIRVHGAHYVGNKNAGRSRGCFCCKQEVHEQLIQVIKGGSFMFSYFG